MTLDEIEFRVKELKKTWSGDTEVYVETYSDYGTSWEHIDEMKTSNLNGKKEEESIILTLI